MIHKLFVAALLTLCTLSLASPPPRPPNILILLTDDQGYNDLSSYGSPTIRTPRLDALAAAGMRFTDFYSAAPVCTPSRAALLTGCYPQRNSMSRFPAEPDLHRPGDKDVLYARSRYGLHPDEITLPELLKPQGYATACIGKWHLGDRPPFLPTRQGFDHYLGIPYSNDMRPSVLLSDETPVENPVDQPTLTKRYTEEAVKFITESKDKPFFLYLAYAMPHVPLHASDDFKGKSPRGPFGDAIEEIDHSAGTIVDTLKALNLTNDTLVIFTSDNGPWLIKGEAGGSAFPLRAGKRTTYEGGMRVPCIMSWPSRIPAGTTCRQLAATIDLFPTLAALAGAPLPTDRTLDGKDIRPLLFNEPGAKSPHDYYLYYNGPELNAIRSGPWKLKFQTTLIDEYGYGQLDNPTTPIPPALYNLDTDLAEQKNLYADHPEVVARLTQLADAARQDLGDARQNLPPKNPRPVGHLPTPTTTRRKS
jgi:arylsulfatase A-like enzyme